MKILLAEDDTNIALIIQLCLEKIGGHQVVLCSDGQNALEWALREPFDLFLLDGMMPRKSGAEVATELRAADMSSTPIIFLSAKTDEKDLRLFSSLGKGYISKPFDPKTICSMIDGILGRPEAMAA
jgi:DNA-binding response OmpR family regulator